MKIKLSELVAEIEQYRATHTHAEVCDRYVGRYKVLGECQVPVTPEALEAVLWVMRRNSSRADLIMNQPEGQSRQLLLKWFEDTKRELSVNTARFEMVQPEPVQARPYQGKLITSAIDKLIIKPVSVPEPETPPNASKKTVKV